MRGLPPGCWGCEGRSNPCTCEQAQLVQVPPMPQRGGSSQGEVARGPGGRADKPMSRWASDGLRPGILEELQPQGGCTLLESDGSAP